MTAEPARPTSRRASLIAAVVLALSLAAFALWPRGDVQLVVNLSQPPATIPAPAPRLLGATEVDDIHILVTSVLREGETTRILGLVENRGEAPILVPVTTFQLVDTASGYTYRAGGDARSLINPGQWALLDLSASTRSDQLLLQLDQGGAPIRIPPAVLRE